MAIEGFDYKAFAEMMVAQGKELVPATLQDNEKEYIIKTLGNFTMLAGEALYNDTQMKLNAEQAVFITQIIAEWSFHKSIDLIHSGILPQYWDSIMQNIAFTIFEIAKNALAKNLPQDQILQIVESHVNKVYKQNIDDLQQKGLINEEVKTRAESQSNIDAMAQTAREEELKYQQEVSQQAEKNATEAQKRRETKEKSRARNGNVSSPSGITYKEMKLMTLALVLKILSQDKVMTILNKFDSNDSLAISQYMNMADLESKLDGDLVTDCLKEMKTCLPIKRKLTKENVLMNLLQIYKTNPREKIEKIVKSERPLVKRFIAQTYDGEFGDLPLRVAGILDEYITENV